MAGGISYIDANFELTDASASPAGLPVSYDRGGSREGGEEAWVPSFAFKTRLDDRFDLGLAVSAPYGLSTEYDKDWIGRYHAIETDLTTIDIQPTLNYRATDRLNLAVGLRASMPMRRCPMRLTSVGSGRVLACCHLLRSAMLTARPR